MNRSAITAASRLSAMMLFASLALLLAGNPTTAFAAPKSCGRFKPGGRITAGTVASITCNEQNLAELFKTSGGVLKEVITSCNEVAAEPPDQQHWTLVEEGGVHTELFAETSLSSGLDIIPKFGQFVSLSGIYYDKHQDPAAGLKAAQAASKISEGGRKWEDAKTNLATAGEMLRSHDCKSAEVAQEDLKKYFTEGSKQLNSANNDLSRIAHGG